MPRLLLVLAMLLVQTQPLAGVLLCHQSSPCHSEAVVSAGPYHASHRTPDHSSSIPLECAAMLACATTPPVVVPVMASFSHLIAIPQSSAPLPTLRPAAVFAAPPFHPPSA